MSEPSPNPPTPTTNSAARPPRSDRGKPRVSLVIATAFGLGYLPKAPGTWGSLAGILIYSLTQFYFPLNVIPGARLQLIDRVTWAAWTGLPVTLAIALAGVWCATRAAQFSGKKDPQFVVIDEVSGQHITYLFSLTLLDWKYLLLGFILFRVFDIWKPFPARQAESLPGGLGIMADDWIAGIYAALGLWIARAIGL
ncbi:MAG: phosphatidylglycerophosphatase A [Acidobacteriia bacterium]|nr:phosphatidylglycerophosphatase A [Terriglobia bacterium]